MNTESIPEYLIGPDKVMDERHVPCSIKHNRILRNCVELAVGDHFVLVNGRDPAHLREDIATHWPGAFAWEYLVRQSDEVRVKITKLKEIVVSPDLDAPHECSH